MLRCIAIDDEPIALDIIRFHAEKVPFLSLQRSFVSAVDALTYLREHPVELVFLDVNMPDLTGIEVARMLPAGTLVVFTTAYAEHAVKGFELDAVDYLVKPIDFGRFLQAANRANARKTPEPAGGNVVEPAAPKPPAPGRDPVYRDPVHRDPVHRDPVLFVKDGYDYVRISLNELLYIESEGNYLTFYETGKKVVTRMTISEAVTQLPPSFMRIHKSYIVALDRIDKIERHQVTIGKVQVPLAGTYRDELLTRVNK